MTIRKTSPGERIQASLDVLQLQSSRAHLYEQLRRETRFVIDPVLYPIMSALDRLGPLRITALAKEIGLDRSAVSRHLARLERTSVVERSPDPYDHRATMLQLTQKGRVEFGHIQREIARQIDRQLATWPDGEAEQFARQLERFIDGVSGAWSFSSSAADL